MELDSNQSPRSCPTAIPSPWRTVSVTMSRASGPEASNASASANRLFDGHFPQQHIFPGVLILEAMAQVGAIAILSLPENKGKIALFGGVKNARFKRQVVPGDVLEMECVLTRRRGPVGIGTCKATVNGEVACTAELTFAIRAE